MSSYNENLNSSVAASLQAQELEQNNMQTQLNAAMFTLYYAEDAKITANEKLESANKNYMAQQTIKEAAVDNNNIAVNLLASANLEKQYTDLSVTNTAVSAANVQVAANAIVRLASDIGGIVGILNAADYGSQIYEQAVEVNKLMSDTAYNAEVTSQWAMETSALTAEISAKTVADSAKTTANAVANLLTVMSSQFDTTAALVNTSNKNLEAASVAEKVAEGALEDIKVEYEASEAAYELSVNELNLNLTVTDNTIKDPSFTVQFNPYLNPFYDCAIHDPSMKNYHNSPVRDYYIMLVKESEKTLFSLSTAEGLIGINEKLYVKIPALQGTNAITRTIQGNDLYDTDGKPIVLGESYVIFVMAQFTIEYKKSLNNFEDYLTAPSAPFTMTKKLSSAITKSIKVDNNKKIDHNRQILSFNVIEDDSMSTVEYRCMLLPDNITLIQDLLTYGQLQEVTLEVQKQDLKQDKEQENLKINEDIASNNNLLEAVIKELNENIAIAARTPKLDTIKSKLESRVTELQESIKTLQASIQNTTIDQEDVKETKQNIETVEEQEAAVNIKPGFFFNKLMAENVTEGNYLLANSAKIEANDEKSHHKGTHKYVIIPDNATDNFGNPLIEGNLYIPTILSYANGNEKNRSMFTNALSVFQSTKSFKYVPATKI